MRSHQRFAISALMIFAGSAVIWFLGWFLWCQFQGWTYIKNTTFQHLLLLLISAWIVGALAKARPHNFPENTTKSVNQIIQQPENNPHQCPRTNPDLKALTAKVDELLAKQTDVHAIMKFFKARELKDSLKRPIRKSEIKIEIPEEIAEKLIPQKNKLNKPETKEVN